MLVVLVLGVSFNYTKNRRCALLLVYSRVGTDEVQEDLSFFFFFFSSSGGSGKIKLYSINSSPHFHVFSYALLIRMFGVGIEEVDRRGLPPRGVLFVLYFAFAPNFA